MARAERRGFGLVGEDDGASLDFGDDLFGCLGPDERVRGRRSSL